MCLIVCRAAPRATANADQFPFDAVWAHNPDGFGVSQVVNGRLVINKALNKEKSRRMFLKVCAEPHSFVAHFRFRTRGKKTMLNVHPFRLGRHPAIMAHNGTLETDEGPQGESDSLMFCRNVLTPLADIAGLQPMFTPRSKVSKMLITLTSGSRVALMNATGNIVLYGRGWTTWNELDISNAYSLTMPAVASATETEWDAWKKQYAGTTTGWCNTLGEQTSIAAKTEADYGDAATVEAIRERFKDPAYTMPMDATEEGD